MANRYANLVGSNKISEEYTKINDGFDAVETDMDGKAPASVGTDLAAHIGSGGASHAAATPSVAGFMSAGDKTKLDGVEEGAETNQNAFAQVNDIDAANPSDGVTLEGGVGITVTTNPTEKKVTITATGSSTPGPHGPSHTEFGPDPVPNATETEGGLMSAVDKAKLDGMGDEISDLAGAGRTTETVKGNADAIASVAADVVDLGDDLAAQKADTTSRGINAKYLPIPYVSAIGDGVADDTIGIKNAIDLALSTGIKKVELPAGTYKITSKESVTGTGVIIEGNGRGSTIISYQGADGDAFEISGDYCEINNIQIKRTGTPTSGAGIKLINNTFGCAFDNLVITGFYYGLDAQAAKSWNLTDSYIVNNIKYEVYIRNTSSPDSGDQVITGCTFDSSIGTDAAIRHESGGGVKITGNKILSHGIGYDLQVADGAATSVAIIDGNSIEMQTVRHIRLGRLGTTGTYSQIDISNNQHNFTTSITEGVLIQAGASTININGNIANGYNAAPYVNITGGSNVNIDGNQINSWQIGVKIAAGLDGIRVGPNNYVGVSKPIEDNTIATSGTRPPLIDHLYNKKINAVISDSVYTNLFRIDMQTFRSCTIELTLDGVLQGAGVFGRHIKQLITRASGNATQTSVSDTNGGSVVDVQFDNTTTAGSVIIGIRRNTAAGGTQLDGIATLRISGHVQAINIL